MKEIAQEQSKGDALSSQVATRDNYDNNRTFFFGKLPKIVFFDMSNKEIVKI